MKSLAVGCFQPPRRANDLPRPALRLHTVSVITPTKSNVDSLKDRQWEIFSDRKAVGP